MASAFDKLPKQLQSLQLLIDQFRDAEEWEERDEVLADIIGHDTPEALAFLRLVASNLKEDVYSRCDAICGIVVRTGGKDYVPELLAYLADVESEYEYCRAADAAADALVKEAAPALWEAWAKELTDTERHSTILALEALDPAQAADRFMTELEAQKSLDTLDYMRAELLLKTLGRIHDAAIIPRLQAWEGSLRALAKQHPEDEAEFHDTADLAQEAVRVIKAPVEDLSEQAADDEDDDE